MVLIVLLVPALTPVLLPGCSTFSMETLQRYISVGTSSRCGDGKIDRHHRVQTLILGQAGDMDDVSITLAKGMPRTKENVNGG